MYGIQNCDLIPVLFLSEIFKYKKPKFLTGIISIKKSPGDLSPPGNLFPYH